MALLYVGSLRSRSGKNLLTLGLASRMMKDGLKLSVMKPFGASPVQINGHHFTDSEAWMINETLGLGQSPEQCCPVVRTQDLIAHSLAHQAGDLFGAVKNTLNELQEQNDLVIMAGSQHMAFGAMCDLSGYQLAEALDATVLLVDRYENEFYLDNLLSGAERIGENLAGVVMNNIDQEMAGALESQIKPFLDVEGIKTLGFIPTDDTLSAVAVGTIAEALGAQLLTSKKASDQLLKRFYIGAMQVRNAAKYFSGSRDFGAIIGGDRPDMQLAAIEGGAGCIILTGNLYPSDIIISRAEENEVPVLLVRGDTFSVAHRLEVMRSRLALKEPAKADRAIELVDEHVDFATLYSILGVGPK